MKWPRCFKVQLTQLGEYCVVNYTSFYCPFLLIITKNNYVMGLASYVTT